MPTFVTRTIGPKRAKLIDEKYFLNEIRRTLKNKVGPELVKELKKPTRQWQNHKPEFATNVSASRNFIALEVYATGDDAWLYNLISEGEQERIIHAKPGKSMAFPQKYTSSTLPGKLWSRKAKGYGDVVYAKSVRHSIDARDFYGQVEELKRKDVKREMENAVRRAVRRG